DQHGEEDAARPAAVGQLVEGGPDGPAGEQDVVDDCDDALLDAADGQPGLPHDRARAHRHEVVTIQRYVEGSGRDGHPLGAFDFLREQGGEVYAAAVDADENEPVDGPRLLDDLVGHAGDDATHGFLVEQH